MRSRVGTAAIGLLCMLFGGIGCDRTPVNLTASARAPASINVWFIVASRTSSSHERRPTFVSADTAGVTLTLTGSASLSQSVAIGPGAAACGGNESSPRTCSATLTVPPGSYTVTATTYDAAPVGGLIPNSAHELAIGVVTGVTVAAGHANSTSVYVGGLVSAYGSPTYLSVPANGITQQVGFALAPTDYDNEQITTSSSAPYANPITLSLVEHGGSGHESLVKNGVTVGSVATISQASDAVEVAYDGGGSPGYYGSVSISASGVSTATVNVSPLYVVPSGAFVGTDGAAGDFTGSGETGTLTISEAGAPTGLSYTRSVAAACSGVVTATSPSGTSSSSTVSLTSGSTVNDGSCTITIADNTGTGTNITLPVYVVSQPTLAQTGPIVTATTYGDTTLTLPELPLAGDRLFVIGAANNPLDTGRSYPAGWSSIASHGVLIALYCVVGTDSGDCPPATSYEFGGNGTYAQILDVRGGNSTTAPSIATDTAEYGFEVSSFSRSLSIPTWGGLAFTVWTSYSPSNETTAISQGLPSGYSATTITYSVEQEIGGNGLSLLTTQVLNDPYRTTQPFTITGTYTNTDPSAVLDGTVIWISP